MGNSKKTTYVPLYQTVTSSNPYASATVTPFGSSYKLNSFLTNLNNTIENQVPTLYQKMLNPTLDDAISQARIQAFTNAFNTQSKANFENNLINPLSERRMLRSSLVKDLANNLQASQAEQIANFNNQLLINSISDTQSLIDMLMNQYETNANIGKNTLSAAQTDSSKINSYYRDIYKKNNSDKSSSNYLSSTLSFLNKLF